MLCSVRSKGCHANACILWAVNKEDTAGARSYERQRAMGGAVLRGLQELGGQLVPAGTYQQLARAAQRTVRGGGGDAFIMLNVLDALPHAHRGAPECQR